MSISTLYWFGAMLVLYFYKGYIKITKAIPLRIRSKNVCAKLRNMKEHLPPKSVVHRIFIYIIIFIVLINSSMKSIFFNIFYIFVFIINALWLFYHTDLEDWIWRLSWNYIVLFLQIKVSQYSKFCSKDLVLI